MVFIFHNWFGLGEFVTLMRKSLDAILMITSRLIKQGFRYTKLVKSLKKFYTKYIYLMDNHVCFRRHISEGICPLYIGVPALFKHVTTEETITINNNHPW